jgi:putative ABC transport system ATP-binding protein
MLKEPSSNISVIQDDAKGLVMFQGVSKVYGTGPARVEALKDVNLVIPAGSYISIMGPSGSGKSTLLAILGLLDKPSTGKYVYFGKDVARMRSKELARLRRAEIGFVFQAFNLLQGLTALENVQMPMMYDGVPLLKQRQRASALLERVGLSHRMHAHPNEMSGGEQQRVAIARALANSPEVILADEPTGNLDSKSGEQVIALLESLWEQEGITLIIVTHDPSIGSRAKRMVRLRDGQIEEDKWL